MTRTINVLGGYCLGCVCLLTQAPRVACAQFNIPLPKSMSPAEVRREDFQILFASQQAGRSIKEKMEGLRTELARARIDVTRRQSLNSRAENFCKTNGTAQIDQCIAALEPDSLRRRLGSSQQVEEKLTRIHFGGLVPPSRPILANYMRRSGTGEAFAFASQFGANVGENEAYVVSNIIRGLTGRAIFTADFAAVVTKADSANPAKRDTVENDKANVIRAINNGGTLVGRFTAPLYARSGATGAGAAGATFSLGIIGPISERDYSKRKGVVSATLETLGALAVRSLEGDAEQTAELLYGLRVGYTLADGPITALASYKDVGFVQGVAGLRQKGSMSVSALVTLANHGFEKAVPKLVLNFAAVR